MTIALIDGDIVTYRVGFTTQDVDVNIALSRLNTLMNNILEDVESEAGYKVFLTDTEQKNFRFKLYPQYKAGRPHEKPLWYKELRATLIADFGAEVSDGVEADDLMGLAQTKESVICTIDKDLDQIAGSHYDFVKQVKYEVSPEDALRFFYFQLLVGDRIDNIPGARGIGPRKAEKIIDGCETEQEYQDAVYGAYLGCYGDRALDLMTQYGQCLWIQRKGRELWTPHHIVEE